MIYNSERELVVSDGGGSGWTQMSGLLGPIGMLAAIGAHAASKLTVVDRVDTRSKEFSAAVQDSMPDQNLNAQCAERIVALLEASGREVKVTAAARATGSDRLADSVVPGVQFTPGFARLILRVSAGYGAESATSSYRPNIVIESVLWQDDATLVYEDIVRKNDGDPSYLTYARLLGEHVTAFEGLRQELLKSAEAVCAHQFGLVALAGS